MSRVSLTLALLAIGAVSASADLYSPTPSGYVLSHCIHTVTYQLSQQSYCMQVPSNSRVLRHDNGSLEVFGSDASHYLIPRCNNVVNGQTVPVVLPRAATNKDLELDDSVELPSDYNGWLACKFHCHCLVTLFFC